MSSSPSVAYDPQKWVREFMIAGEQLVPESPVDHIAADFGEFRYDLMAEELTEFKDAVAANDLVAVADALGDLLVTVYGTALSFGIDLYPVMAEIQRSNMTKFIGGLVKREDGKILKGPRYEPPNLEMVIQRQRAEREESCRPSN